MRCEKPVMALVGPVDSLGLEQYPFGPEERLDGNSFVKWHTARWLSSTTFKLAGWEAQGMIRGLFDMCQTESPIGTLPDDDNELAYMLRVTPQRMRELRVMEFGPLRNWRKCLCGNRVRLMHPVVVEVIRDALERREMAALSKEQRAVAIRLERLRAAMAANGVSKEVIADDVLIGRMDDWLLQGHPRNRTKAVYRSAILHAVQLGWFSRGDAGDAI